MTSTVELELCKLLAQRDIERLLYAYHDALNRGRVGELAQLFEHATYQTAYAATSANHGVQTGAEVTQNWRDMVLLYGGLPRVQYMTTNVVVHVDDSLVSARSLSYYLGLQALSDYYDSEEHADPFPLQPICAGRYEDTFETIDGTWRFRSRQIHADLSGDLSRHLGIKPTEYQAAQT